MGTAERLSMSFAGHPAINHITKLVSPSASDYSYGGAHPLTVDIEGDLQGARAALAARETPQPAEDLAEEVD